MNQNAVVKLRPPSGYFALDYFEDSLRDGKLSNAQGVKIHRRLIAIVFEYRAPTAFGMANALPRLQFH